MKDYVTTLQDNLSFVNREQHNMTFGVAFQLAGEVLRLEELLKEETL